MSSVWALYDRVVLGLTSTSKGQENLLRERQLVLNFPSPELWPKVDAIAATTGRNPIPPHKEKIGYRFEADKFDAAGLTPQAADLVRPMRIAECPIQFEAEVVAAHPPLRNGLWSVPKPSPSSKRRSFASTRTRISLSPAPTISIPADGARCFTCFDVTLAAGRISAALSRQRDDACSRVHRRNRLQRYAK